MKTIIKLTILFFVFITLTSFQSMVYICKGPSSKVYHKSNRCKGLSHCSTEIYKVSVDEAKQMGRRECRIEY